MATAVYAGMNAFAFEVYTAALNLLPRDYDERQNVATVAAYLAMHGENVKLIAAKMERSESFIRDRIEEAMAIFDPGPR